jgi:hypothetical protein
MNQSIGDCVGLGRKDGRFGSSTALWSLRTLPVRAPGTKRPADSPIQGSSLMRLMILAILLDAAIGTGHALCAD